MTLLALAGVALIVTVVLVIASKTFRYILLAATVALVVCLVAFPRARLCVGQAATSIAGKFVPALSPVAVAVPVSEQPALASEPGEDQGDEDGEVADADSGSNEDSEDGSSLIVQAYGAGAGAELVTLLASQGRDPVQKLMGMVKLALNAQSPTAAAAGEDTPKPEQGMK